MGHQPVGLSWRSVEFIEFSELAESIELVQVDHTCIHFNQIRSISCVSAEDDSYKHTIPGCIFLERVTYFTYF